MSRLKKWFGKAQDSEPEKVVHQVTPRAEVKITSGLKSSAIKDLDHTFYRYLVSKSLLQSEQTEVDSEIPDNRILLDIELGPALKRQADRQASKELFHALQAQLFQLVEERSEEKIAALSPETVRRFSISENLMAAVNILNSRAASISRLKPLLQKETAVLQNMINLLNRFDIGQKSTGKPLELKDAELSLSFLGIDQLRVLLPFLIMHESLKETGRKFNQTSRKIWQHLQITAEAARVLAVEEGASNADEIYMEAIFHEIGAAYILHLLDESFTEAIKEISLQAKESGASEVSHRVSEVKSAAPVLDKLLPLRAGVTSYRLAQQYKLSHVQLGNTLEQLSGAMTFDELGPNARLIAQGRAYAVFKQMFKAALMTKEQAAEYLKYYQLDANKIRLLNKGRYLRVPINES